MWCSYVQNFSGKTLPDWYSTRKNEFSTHPVDINSLTFRHLRYLSTISIFGAKLISLYLFPSKISVNLSKNPQITLWISSSNTAAVSFPYFFHQVIHRVIHSFILLY